MNWNYIKRDGNPPVDADAAYLAAIRMYNGELIMRRQWWMNGEWQTCHTVYAWQPMPEQPPLEPPNVAKQYALAHAAELDAAIAPGRHIILEEATEGIDEDGQPFEWAVELWRGDVMLWGELSHDPVDTLLNPCNGMK